MTYCVACGARLADGAVACPACGETAMVPRGAPYGAAQATPVPVQGAAHAPPGYVPALPPAHAAPTMGVAVVGLLLNVLIWPGLGSLVGGKQEGWAQGFGFLIGIPLAFVLIGIPILIGTWIWGIVTGVEMINEASAAERARPVY